MATNGLQRTLVVGLGQVGVKTTDHLLADLLPLVGEATLIQGLAVAVEEIELNNVESHLLVSPEADFETWQADFEEQVELSLHHISQLNNLAWLAQQGFTLRHADEIHVIIVANVAEAWINRTLAGVIDVLRQTVNRTLACHIGMTGVLLLIPSVESEASDHQESGQPMMPSFAVGAQANLLDDWIGSSLLLDDFGRGCFLASLTNEVGLIVGDADTLIQRTVYFLTLLIREISTGNWDWSHDSPAGWGVPLTSFGLATLCWPGQELVNALSARWTKHLLTQLMTLPPMSTPTDLTQKAREAAQQLMRSKKLVPSLLIDRLTALMPSLPHHLVAVVPDWPWPWLLVDVQSKLENAAQRWQENWLAGRDRLQTTLAELETDWGEQAESWLKQQLLAASKAGIVLTTQSFLAAVTELLRIFIEGVEHNLAEAEIDLANIDQRLGEVAEALIDELATFPDSPLAMLLSWGPHPSMWWRYWSRCRRTQTLARNFAHLTRGRLMAWQTVSYYEEVLPFYRRLLTGWGQRVETWEHHCQQVTQAAQSPALTKWAAQLEQCLTNSAGPWTDSLVTTLYEEGVGRHYDVVWEQSGTFIDWSVDGLAVEEIVQRLVQATAQALWPSVAMPVDQVLYRQLPGEKARLDWLAGMVEQARPFWRYDEATLAESVRRQVHQETWLLLPDAESSPLAHLSQTWSHPLRLLSSRNPEELGVITLRHWAGLGKMEIEENDT
jgi:hypothetical protein